MSDDVDHIAPEDEGRVLAAEYVLGVLSAEERRAVEKRIAEESSFAREIADWEDRLGPMASYVTPVTPPAQTWMRIEASLGTPTSTAAVPPATIWQSLAFWRGLGIGASAIAAACVAALVYVGMRPTTLTPRVPLLATLTGLKTNQPNFVAAISTDGRSLTIVPASLLTADKRSMELWLIPEGGKPASLGLIAAGQPVQLNVPPALLPLVGSGATLAVSLEPLGGSPTGQPTGEVIAHGNLSRL
ncbi:MAG TPA: anti-sigma factor [Xanthobacteraceae bacterium]|nr:anti-sigma factor [Xanthobacteraceae bacterium]